MKGYYKLSFKVRLLILGALALILAALIVFNPDNSYLDFLQGFIGGMLIALVFAEVVFFFTNRKTKEEW